MHERGMLDVKTEWNSWAGCKAFKHNRAASLAGKWLAARPRRLAGGPKLAAWRRHTHPSRLQLVHPSRCITTGGWLGRWRRGGRRLTPGRPPG